MAALSQDYNLSPVTALAFPLRLEAPHEDRHRLLVDPVALPYRKATRLLLTGEGCTLKVFNTEGASCIGSQRLFQSQPIHGIDCQEYDRDPVEELSTFKCLVWGGRCVIVLDIQVSKERSGLVANFQLLTKELATQDRILHGRLSPGPWWTDGFDTPFLQAVIVSAHNELFSIKLSRVFKSDPYFSAEVELATQLSSSILYCAQICWHAPQPADAFVLVAAGTAFGEVILWSYELGNSSKVFNRSTSAHLLRSLHGHEGSIFGVHISELKNCDPLLPTGSKISNASSFLVISCSDDRTVRAWEIKEPLPEGSHSVELDPISQGRKAEDIQLADCSAIATAMGHSSRIWSVRAMCFSRNATHVFSFGEDAIEQHWKLNRGTSNLKEKVLPSLRMSRSYAFHSGKHIWAADAQFLASGKCLIATGGADGRVNMHVVADNDQHTNDWTSSATSLNQVIRNACSAESDMSISTTYTESIFNAMEGEWEIHRDINSRVTSYPSGIFEGTASLTRRPPTGNGYNGEILYHEKGRFRTNHGLVLEGSRRYVYRYDSVSQNITAWFVKVQEQAEVDYLFHQVTFNNSQEDHPESSDSLTTATGHHLCVRDDYNAEYVFNYQNGSMDSWSLCYVVTGPEKDYTSTAKYTRLRGSENSHDETADGKPKAFALSNDAFRSYCWLDDGSVLTTTCQGRVLVSNTVNRNVSSGPVASSSAKTQNQEIEWRVIGELEDLISHNIVERVPGYGAVLSGKSGTIYGYDISTCSIKAIGEVPRKPARLFATKLQINNTKTDTVVVSSLGDLRAYIVPIVSGSEFEGSTANDKYHPITLNLPAHFVPTSVTFVPSIKSLVLGSRRGTICIFRISRISEENAVEPSLVTPYLHGDEAVTSIRELPIQGKSTSGTYILTSGRDGQILISSIQISCSDGLRFTCKKVHEISPPLGPFIEGVFVDPKTLNVLVWGFRGKVFVVYNCTTQKAVMEVDCGGAHRSWAYMPYGNGKEGGRLVWTKASTCHIVLQAEASHQVLQQGGHGREVRAIAVRVHPFETKNMLVATGSEDTTIRISEYRTGIVEVERGLHTLSVLTKHVTSVQQLRWSQEGRYLFSAAGGEEFFVWRVQPVPCIRIGAVRVGVCPKVTESGDLRIMDFEVMSLTKAEDENESENASFLINMVYSDSSVRRWVFDKAPAGQGIFTQTSMGSYSSNCLTTAAHLQLNSATYLLSGSTDGHIALWPCETKGLLHPSLIDTPGSLLPKPSPPMETLPLLLRHAIHQSSIKTIALQSVSRKVALLATGGDDNALALTLMVVGDDKTSPLPKCKTTILPRAHAASITGVAWLPPTTAHDDNNNKEKKSFILFSTSNDQRLRCWQVRIISTTQDFPSVEVQKLGSWQHSEVADAACLSVCHVLSSDSHSFSVKVDDDAEKKHERVGEVKVVIGGIGVEIWDYKNNVKGKGKEDEAI